MDGEFSVISAAAAATTTAAVQTTLWHFPNLIKILSEIDTRAPPRQCSFQMYLSPKVLGGVNIYSGQIGLSLTSSLSVMKSAGWNMTTVSTRTARAFHPPRIICIQFGNLINSPNNLFHYRFAPRSD